MCVIHDQLHIEQKKRKKLETGSKMRKKYRLIDHTADFGIHVFGDSLQDLFENAAHAMFEQIVEPNTLKRLDTYKTHVKGDDWPDLMVNWLRELLFLWTGKELFVKHADIQTISEYDLTATLSFEPFDPDRHIIKNELKAVTYHQIQVDRGPSGWEARIIFDV